MQFHVRTNSKLEEKTTDEWLEMFPDAKFKEQYAYFNLEAINAQKAIDFLRKETGARYSDISIWRTDGPPPPWSIPE